MSREFGRWFVEWDDTDGTRCSWSFERETEAQDWAEALLDGSALGYEVDDVEVYSR